MPIKLRIALVAIGIFLIAIVASVGYVNIEGSERVIWQDWGGVQDQVGEDGLHIYLRFKSTPHRYYIGADTFIVGDAAANPNNNYMEYDELQFNEPDMNPIVVPVQMELLSLEDKAAGKTPVPTDVTIMGTMRYKINAATLVKLHKENTNAYRTNLIQPVVKRVIIDNVTKLDARTVFLSGRTELQIAIQEDMIAHKDLVKFGIIIDEFVLDSVSLNDKDFVERMQAEAIAEQRSRTALKETEAAEAEALRAKAEAQAEQNKRLVEAETKKQEEIAIAQADKEKQILSAEAAAEKVRVAAIADAEKVKVAAIADAEKVRVSAEADKEKMALEGEGLKLRKVAEAEGVLALGKAEAEAKKLILAAYQGEGGQRYAEVEKAKHLGEGIEKIYYIPEKMTITAIADDFAQAVKIAVPTK
ncbi:MAG: hypothetical protein HRU15_00760 [Planctomycetes bacterium]|nr:hypothetical protein [Planctomycetota bacterium]